MKKNLNTYSITRPTLLLDPEKCKANIHRMAVKAIRQQIKLRPHFKTHQSAQISEWIRAEGVNSCSVSSVKMAEYFARHGWDDILIAFPANILESQKLNELGDQIKIQVLIYDVEALKMLAQKVDASIGIKIELDLGNHRSGVSITQYKEINELINRIESVPNFQFTGFYAHPGHTYLARSKAEVNSIYSEVIEEVEILKSNYTHTPGFSITVGDTPGCTVADDFGSINEISPGNFVFYDVMQVNIGTCRFEDIAVVVACPVVGKNLERKELVIHGGAVHFSKEQLQDADGITNFGKLAVQMGTGWGNVIPDAYLKSVSQEHGIIHCSEVLLQNTQIGDVVYVYPAHSCLTADLMKSYLTTDNAIMQGESAFMI